MDEEELHEYSLVLDRTPEEIQQEIGDMVMSCSKIKEPVEFCEKILGSYIYVQELYQIKRSRYIRWINKKTGKKGCGGSVCNIQFKQKSEIEHGSQIQNENDEKQVKNKKQQKTGIFILCRIFSGHFISINYNEHLIFQKLSPREILYLDILSSTEEGKIEK